MRLPDCISDGWSQLFATVAIMIFMTMTAPALFGLQNYTQWGGMYDDHWCHAFVFEESPYINPSTPTYMTTAGDRGQPRIYSAPSHNRTTCLVWVRTLCNERSKDGWIIHWVEPMLQSTRYLEKQNACDLLLPGTEHWYFHAK